MPNIPARLGPLARGSPTIRRSLYTRPSPFSAAELALLRGSCLSWWARNDVSGIAAARAVVASWREFAHSAAVQPVTLLALAFVPVLLSSCAAPSELVAPSTPPMWLAANDVRKVRATTMSFPDGVYTPSFQTRSGVYYKAPSNIIVRGLGMTMIKQGGVFIPFPTESDQRQGVWYDETGQDIIGAMASQPTHKYSFAPPLPFRPVRGGGRVGP